MKSVFKSLLFSSCILSLLLCGAALAAPYQLYLVRHAEKASSEADPELSSCGQQQAKALAILLQDLALPTLYHTPYRRTAMTAKALLKQQRQLQSYDPSNLVAFAAQLQQNQQSAVIVGHSNTTPELTSLLADQSISAMAETDYGLIYQLVFSGQQLVALNRLQLPPVGGCGEKSDSNTL